MALPLTTLIPVPLSCPHPFLFFQARPGLGIPLQEGKAVGKQSCGDSGFPLPFPPILLDAHLLFASESMAYIPILFPLCFMVSPRLMLTGGSGKGLLFLPSPPTLPVLHGLYARCQGMKARCPPVLRIPTPLGHLEDDATSVFLSV